MGGTEGGGRDWGGGLRGGGETGGLGGKQRGDGVD